MTNLSFLKQNNIDQSIVETSEHTPKDLEKNKKRKADAVNKVVKKLKLEPELVETFVTTKYEDLGLVKEEVKEEVYLNVDNHSVEFKAPNSSLETNLPQGCPGQATVLLECGICQQKFQDILDIDNHWQFEDCWSGARQVGTKIKTPVKKSDVNSPAKKTSVKTKTQKKAKVKTPRKRTQGKRKSKKNKGN